MLGTTIFSTTNQSSTSDCYIC